MRDGKPNAAFLKHDRRVFDPVDAELSLNQNGQRRKPAVELFQKRVHRLPPVEAADSAHDDIRLCGFALKGDKLLSRMRVKERADLRLRLERQIDAGEQVIKRVLLLAREADE